jgi:rfaE bifunctional protein nucleotidyltransferase chain/domain
MIFNKKVVFTNGCFDAGLTKGHVDYLEAAKKLGDILIVAINSDESVRRLKGEGRPILPIAERIAIVQALRCVDYAWEFEEDTPLEAINHCQPDIVVKGGDYKAEDVVSGGREVVILPFVECVGTTAKIARM